MQINEVIQGAIAVATVAAAIYAARQAKSSQKQAESSQRSAEVAELAAKTTRELAEASDRLRFETLKREVTTLSDELRSDVIDLKYLWLDAFRAHDLGDSARRDSKEKWLRECTATLEKSWREALELGNHRTPKSSEDVHAAIVVLQDYRFKIARIETAFASDREEAKGMVEHPKAR